MFPILVRIFTRITLLAEYINIHHLITNLIVFLRSKTLQFSCMNRRTMCKNPPVKEGGGVTSAPAYYIKQTIVNVTATGKQVIRASFIPVDNLEIR